MAQEFDYLREELPSDELGYDNNDDYETYDEINMETYESFTFKKITRYSVQDGTLTFKVKYTGDIGDIIWDIPFSILKDDQPIETAKYIRDNVHEVKIRDNYSNWMNETLK